MMTESKVWLKNRNYDSQYNDIESQISFWNKKSIFDIKSQILWDEVS